MPGRTLGQPGVALGHGAIGVREPVELEVVALRDALVERVEDLAEILGVLDGVQDERRHALHGDIDEDAERSEAQRHGGQQLGVLGLAHRQQVTGCCDQRRADDLRGDSPESRAGAVRAGRDGARDRLTIDVAEVLHREPERREQVRHLVQPGACQQRDARPLTVDVDEARQIGEVEEDARCDRRSR